MVERAQVVFDEINKAAQEYSLRPSSYPNVRFAYDNQLLGARDILRAIKEQEADPNFLERDRARARLEQHRLDCAFGCKPSNSLSSCANGRELKQLLVDLERKLAELETTHGNND